jgi:hypothetical protein
MEVALEEEMKVLLQHETEKLRKKLSGAHADDPLSIRRDLARKDPVQILVSVFDACNKHFRGPQQARVGSFMQMITEKPALRHLFLLAIYEGAYGADTLVPKFMEDRFPAQASGVPQQNVHVFLQPQGVCITCMHPTHTQTRTWPLFIEVTCMFLSIAHPIHFQMRILS